MLRLLIVSLITCLGFLPVACTLKLQSSDAVCEDLLLKISLKPDQLRYTGCQRTYLHQLPALLAVYEVPGTAARQVETFLIEHFGVEPLRFLCCGWSSPRGGLYSAGEVRYLVKMLSEETLEQNWADIEVFQVLVYMLLELP